MSRFLRPFHRRNSSNSLYRIDRIDDIFNRFFNDLESPLSLFNGEVSSNYSIKQLNDHEYEIQLNAAGFDKDEIGITVEGDVLKVVGVHKAEEQENDYIYKGFSSSFTNYFTIGNSAEVKDTYLNNGILSIVVLDNMKQHKNIKRIPIK